MKRREFLTSAVGLTGSLLPALAMARKEPCPPSSLSVNGSDPAQAACIAPGDAEADWVVRANGPGVVWAHDFRSDAEVLNFLKSPSKLTAGVHDPMLMAHRTAADGVTGGGCLELLNIGSTLAQPVSASSTTLLLKDASDFPNPGSAAAAYELAIQTTVPPMKEVVLVTAKNGNALTVVRGRTFPEPNKFDNKGLAADWGADAAIGTDCRGGWARPFSAIVAGDNGRATDDAAAGGSVPRRSFSPRPGQTVDGLIYNFRRGYYGHRDYHSVYPTWNGENDIWDGEEFYLQFRVKVDPRRFSPENEGSGKLWFIHTMGQSGSYELVMNCPEASRRRFSIYTNFGSNANSRLTSPQGGAAGDEKYVTYMPKSKWESTCLVGDPAGCWEWPAGEWVTLLVHVKPGHDNDFQYPLPGEIKRDENLIVVDTSLFTPVNNGQSLEFETNPVPTKETFKFKGALDITQDGYFEGWDLSFLQGASIPSTAQFTIVSYRVANGRARWKVSPKRARDSLPAGVPSNGDRLKVNWGRVAKDAKYKDTTVEVWVKRSGDSGYVLLYSKADLAWIFGDVGQGVYSLHPPGFNCFQPTGYQNVQDGQIPPRISYWYRFDQVIFSRQFIPAPVY